MPSEASQKYEQAAQTFNTASRGLESMNQTIQQLGATARITDMPMSQAAQLSTINAFQRNLDQRAAALKQAAAGVNLEYLQAVATASKSQLDDAYRTASLWIDQQQLELAKAALLERQLSIKTKEEEVEAENLILDTLASGYVSIHGGAVTPELRQRMKHAKMLGREDAQIYYDAGLRASTMNPDSYLYGAYSNTPGGAFTAIDVVKPAMDDRTRAAYKDIFGTVILAVQANPAYKSMDTREKAALVDAQVAALIANKTRIMDDKDKTNPFLLPALAEFNHKDPRYFGVARNTQLWKTVYQERVAKGEYDKLDHHKLFGDMAEAVLAGKISADKAAEDLTTIVTAGNFINSVARGHNKFGVMPPTSYKVAIDLADVRSLYAQGSLEKATNLMQGLVTSDKYQIISVELRSANSVKEALIKYATYVKGSN